MRASSLIPDRTRQLVCEVNIRQHVMTLVFPRLARDVLDVRDVDRTRNVLPVVLRRVLTLIFVLILLAKIIINK